MKRVIAIDVRCLSDANRTGVGEYTYEFVSSLIASYPDVIFLLFTNSFVPVSLPFPESSHVYHVITRFPNKLFHLLVLFRCIRLDQFVLSRIQKRIPSLTHIDWWYAPNMHFTHLSSHVLFAVTVHDLSFVYMPYYFSLRRQLWHMLLRPRSLFCRADVIITPSKSTAEHVCSFFAGSFDTVRVVYPGVARLFFDPISVEDCAVVRNKYQLPDQFILYIGTIEPRKNVASLLDAFLLLPESYRQQYPLVVVGQLGWNADALYTRLMHTSHVIVLGYIDAEDRSAMYQLATVCLFVSWYEGFGFPPVESMAVGTPVIVSNRSSLPEVTDGAAYVVDPMNIHSVYRGLRRVLEDGMLQDSLQFMGKQRAATFVWDRAAVMFMDILSSREKRL